MRDFFTYFKNIDSTSIMFRSFSLVHLLFVITAIVYITLLFRKYNTLNVEGQRKFQVRMAIYFLVEEAIYTIWVCLVCSDTVWKSILPLELCSLCVYMNAATVFLKKDYLRFFSGVVGLLAGMIAMLYPANISGIYPAFTYRTINFYFLHASFILFSLLQLKDTSLLQYRFLKKNYFIICGMFTTAFMVNISIHTQYMFVGVPPKIGFIAKLYNITGIFLFLPVILCILFLIHVAVIWLLRMIYRVPSHEKKETELPRRC